MAGVRAAPSKISGRPAATFQASRPARGSSRSQAPSTWRATEPSQRNQGPGRAGGDDGAIAVGGGGGPVVVEHGELDETVEQADGLVEAGVRPSLDRGHPRQRQAGGELGHRRFRDQGNSATILGAPRPTRAESRRMRMSSASPGPSRRPRSAVRWAAVQAAPEDVALRTRCTAAASGIPTSQAATSSPSGASTARQVPAGSAPADPHPERTRDFHWDVTRPGHWAVWLGRSRIAAVALASPTSGPVTAPLGPVHGRTPIRRS